MIFAAIADDFNGGTDLAGRLCRHGVRTVLLLGDTKVPEGYDAAVVPLSVRHCRPKEAVYATYEAVRKLQESQPRQYYLHYSPVFDPTENKNTGAIIEAFLRGMQLRSTLAVPFDPARGITHDAAQSVAWLARQTSCKVALLHDGPGKAKIRFAPAANVEDLIALAGKFADAPLLTGSSGLPAALAAEWHSRGWLSNWPSSESLPGDPTLVFEGEGEGEGLEVDHAALRSNPERETGRLLKEVRRSLKGGRRAAIRCRTGQEEVATLYAISAATLVEEVKTIQVTGEQLFRSITEALEIEFAEVLGGTESGGLILRPNNGPAHLILEK